MRIAVNGATGVTGFAGFAGFATLIRLLDDDRVAAVTALGSRQLTVEH